MATASSSARSGDHQGSTIMEGVRDVGASAKRAVTDGLETVRDRAADYLEQGKKTARQFGETVEQQVRDQPVKAVLIAAAAGFLVGMLYMRR
jgi:ElaB/YqjD/DUF883 family membrane-anchored ribosome-binding protein